METEKIETEKIETEKTEIEKTEIEKIEIQKIEIQKIETEKMEMQNRARQNENKRKIIFDCDNTMGIPGCDMDDGLCLLYLLGREDIELLAVSASFGNNRTKVVYDNTKTMLRERNREDIPLWLGGLKPEDWDSESSRNLVKLARAYPHEIDLIVTGSLTNIAGAFVLDPEFFSLIKGIYFMGGITAPLIFEKKEMKELNFSVDYKASTLVLQNGENLHIITGNACLAVMTSYSDFKERLENSSLGQYILKKESDWFAYNDREYGIKGFYNWDMTTVLYYFYPELFFRKKKKILITEENLKTGFLEGYQEIVYPEENWKTGYPEEKVLGRELYFGEIKEKEEVKRKMLEAFA